MPTWAFRRAADPISWFAVVYPALLLNYLGQGAFLLGGTPVAGGKLFYSLVPQSLLYPMVLLATAGDHRCFAGADFRRLLACLSGHRLGLFPRLVVRHTHHAHAGQIYIPFVNWALYRRLHRCSCSRSAPVRRWARPMAWRSRA